MYVRTFVFKASAIIAVLNVVCGMVCLEEKPDLIVSNNNLMGGKKGENKNKRKQIYLDIV